MSFNWNLLAGGLAAAGSDMAQHGTLGPNVNKLVQEFTTQKNYTKLFENMLKGKEMPEDSQITIKGDGATIKLGKSTATKFGFYEQDAPVNESMLGENNPFQQQQQAATAQTGMTMNPTQQRGVAPQMQNPFQFASDNDMVGLSPEHLAMALNMKQSMEEHPQNMMYKDLLIKEARQRLQGDPDAPMIPFETEFGPMSVDMFKSLPTDEKNYQLYRQGVIKEGQQPLDRAGFNNLDEPEQLKLMRGFKNNPELLAMYMDIRKAGQQNININMDAKKDFEEFKTDLETETYGSKYWSKPDAPEKDLQEHLGSKAVKREIDQATIDGKDPNEVRNKAAIKHREQRIKAGRGEIIDRFIENGQYVWMVKFPREDKPRRITYGLSN